MRKKIMITALVILTLFLAIIHSIRLLNEINDLQGNVMDAAETYAELLGETAEGLFLEESYETIEIRLKRGAEKTNAAAVMSITDDKSNPMTHFRPCNSF